MRFLFHFAAPGLPVHLSVPPFDLSVSSHSLWVPWDSVGSTGEEFLPSLILFGWPQAEAKIANYCMVFHKKNGTSIISFNLKLNGLRLYSVINIAK